MIKVTAVVKVFVDVSIYYIFDVIELPFNMAHKQTPSARTLYTDMSSAAVMNT